jgi:hypothetical protein
LNVTFARQAPFGSQLVSVTDVTIGALPTRAAAELPDHGRM